jgi:hypothetical protein
LLPRQGGDPDLSQLGVRRRLVHWPRHAPLPLPVYSSSTGPNAPSKPCEFFPTGCTMPPLRPLTPPLRR